MPRAALLSIHARVEGTAPSTWEDLSLVQLWGPCRNVYTVAAQDLPLCRGADHGSLGGVGVAPPASRPTPNWLPARVTTPCRRSTSSRSSEGASVPTRR